MCGRAWAPVSVSVSRDIGLQRTLRAGFSLATRWRGRKMEPIEHVLKEYPVLDVAEVMQLRRACALTARVELRSAERC